MADTLENYMSVLESRQSVGIIYFSSVTILVYDLILTLHLEIPLVWLSRWNYTKALYLLVRYIPFVANALIICDRLLPYTSSSKCTNVFMAIGWLYFVGLVLAQGVLMIRTWACWGRNKWVGVGLAFWMLPCQIPSGVFMHKFLSSIQFRSPFADPGSNSCFVVYSNRLLWVNWLVFSAGEGATLALMAVFAYRSSRDGDNTPLVKLICRDGLIFYIYLSCVTSINIALTLALNNGFVAAASSIQSAIHSSLTTRIILNIREAASQRLDDFSFDLHMSDADVRASRFRISFAGSPVVLYSDDDGLLG